jgi:hypothetical protein
MSYECNAITRRPNENADLRSLQGLDKSSPVAGDLLSGKIRLPPKTTEIAENAEKRQKDMISDSFYFAGLQVDK